MKLLASLFCLLLSTSIYADSGQFKLEMIQAKRGDVSAQFRVASSYEFGTDVKQDLNEALNWYLTAANKSHARSQFKIGYFYEYGIGVSRDHDLAISWYKKAKINGSRLATKRLIKMADAKKKISTYNQELARAKKVEKAKEIARNIRISKAKEITKAKRILKAKKIAKAKTIARTTKITNRKNSVATKNTRNKTLIKFPNIQKIILNNKWKNKHGSADYIPSTTTTCLGTGDREFTCFSSEKTRNIKGIDVTYIVKSTITKFKSNGSFNVIYNYNGINLSGEQTTASDVYGLTIKKGWQQPAMRVKCQARSRKNITCARGNRNVEFYY